MSCFKSLLIKPWSILASFVGAWMVILKLTACAPGEGEFLATGGDTLLVASGSVNHLSIAAYDLDSGTMRGRYITDFRGDGNDLPRGLAGFDPNTFLAVGSTSNTLYKIGYNGSNDAFVALPAGAAYDIAISPDFANYYVAIANTIQVIQANGTIGNVIGTVGGCTLSGPRSLDFNSAGQLVAINNTSGAVNIYTNPSSPSGITCATAAIGSLPYGVLAHSNGSLYFTRQTGNSVFRTNAAGASGLSIYSNATYISGPTSIVEHPSGDLLVASPTTNTIERLTDVSCGVASCATRVGTVPFIRDTLSFTITDMVVIKNEDGRER